MSFQTRVTLSILVLVLLTAGLSWVAVHRLVLHPFANDVHATWLRQAAFVADEVEAGRDPRELASALGIRVRRSERPIPPRFRERVVDGRRMWASRGRRNVVVLETSRGQLVVLRDLDPDRPARRLPLLLLVLSSGIVVFAVLIARRSTRPLAAATAAMARMGRGDLDHRLALEGPRELVEVARAFNGLADRVHQQLATERQLLAGISHELRTPLTRLRLEVELLRDAGVDGRRLDRIDGDLTQLDDLIGEALDLSRLQLGAAPLQRTEVDLLELATELATDGVVVTGVSTRLSLDRFLVGRAMQNLLANAAKYAPGAPVTLEVHPDGFTVADRGPGVPPEDLPRLFEPFYRTRGGSRRADGHGLGLMLVATITELHGGTVSATDHGPGLRVRVSFPETSPDRSGPIVTPRR